MENINVETSNKIIYEIEHDLHNINEYGNLFDKIHIGKFLE